MPAVFPLMRDYLDGTTASGLHEARLGAEEFGKEVHVYNPAYTDEEIEGVLPFVSDLYFNSASQLARFGKRGRDVGKRLGFRINPGYSHASLGGALYDPGAPGSRFGEVPENLDGIDWSDIHTLHVHSLCEAPHSASVRLIEHVAEHFAPYIKKVSTVNFGGGHFLCSPDYDLPALADAIEKFRDRFGVEVILEPGSGLVVNTGELFARIIDFHRNEKDIAIIDASASTHMPDVLEVPYRPDIVGADAPDALPHTYTLAGKTCMTGDIIGDYSFPTSLQVGDVIQFTDQMHYSFVKTNSFNGNPLANLAIRHEDGRIETVTDFGYKDFRSRLGRPA
ncbi:MAG: carboxynorspermidine decarboxylase, partial [Parvularcula sp.]